MNMNNSDSLLSKDIMIIDDNTENLNLLMEILKGAGYRVRPAKDGKMALRSVQSRLPALILLDIKMPGMDGYEVCRRLKVDEKTRSIPIILITVVEDENQKVKGFQAGAVDYVTKPFHEAELLARVKTHIELRQMQIDLEIQNARLADEISERQQTEEVLRESEAKYQKVSDNSPAVLYQFRMTPDGAYNFPYVSNRVMAILGISPEDVMTDPLKFLSMMHPDDLELFQEGIQKSAESLESFPLTFRCLKDGEVIWIEARGMPDAKTDGSIHWDGFLIDITKRKRAEEALQESERLYRSLFENMLNGFAYCQMFFDDLDKPNDFTYLAVNSAFEIQTGLRNVTGKKVSEIIPGFREADPELLDIYGRVAKSGQSECFEMFVESLQMWVSVSVYSPKHGYFVSVFDVITERKQAEEALKESEAKYRLMVESSRDAIVISQNDTFIFINDAFATMLGYQKEQLLMSSFKKVYAKNAINLLEERAGQRSNGEVVADRYETVFKMKNGTEVPVEANVRIIDYKGQKATFAVIRDITKQKEIMTALQASAGQSNGLTNHIPICAGCNKIRDDEHELHPWVSPAVYINDRLPDINFTHGMCPDCMKKWYPDYVAIKDTDDKVS